MTEETKVPAEVSQTKEAEATTEETGAKKEGKKFECKLLKIFKHCKLGKVCKINKKIAALLVLIAVAIVTGGVIFARYYQQNNAKPEVVKAKIESLLKDQGGEVKEVVKEEDLYKVTISFGGQEQPVYVSKNGKKLIQGVVTFEEIEKQKEAAKAQTKNNVPEKTEAENKTDVPTVDLFVMSYCPYGLQMERGLLPAIEALGSKIKFNLKFVSYTLHGQKEVTENVNQYCIAKTQPAKLDNYLKCFWKDSKGASEACMKAVGINAAQVSTCVADANKQFNPTEKDFSINKDENVKFGVQGSPTLVVNGTKVSSGRDGASVLKAICSGFKNQPKECGAKLSTTSPAPGFDDQAAAAGTGSAASCATN